MSGETPDWSQSHSVIIYVLLISLNILPNKLISAAAHMRVSHEIFDLKPFVGQLPAWQYC